MDTLMEFKNKGGTWLNVIESWTKTNARWFGNYTPIKFKREINISDLQGLAAKIAYSVYKEHHIENTEKEPINEEHLLFKSFLKKQGITAEFSFNLKKFRCMDINNYLIKLQEKKIDIEYGIYMGFPWNFKGIEQKSEFWEYHSNQWKKKLNLFRG